MLLSIVIRTYNEEKHLRELLIAIRKQQCNSLEIEVIIVDSGSTDQTLDIANEYCCRITHIRKDEFTFGRSLNVGCKVANGDILVFVSGHCIPSEKSWLANLIKPIIEKSAVYTYGKQQGNKYTKFSEIQVFKKYYPQSSFIPQDGFFCNNANAALLNSEWENNRFCEELTGLEDMHLAKQLVAQGKKIAYVASAPVFHIHEETWLQVKIRYEREAISLQKIMPEVHVSFKDFLHYYFTAVVHDLTEARKAGVMFSNIKDIIMFRLMQFWGSYKGNHEHRKLSMQVKYRYFYPKNKVNPNGTQYEDSSSITHESPQ